MAPHPLFPNLEASVLVDNRPVDELYDHEDANLQTKIVYIESEAGEQFGVRYYIPGYLFEHYSIKAIVSIDGVDMRKFIFEKRNYDYYGVSRHIYASSAKAGRNFMGQRFRFASLDTHDERSAIEHELQEQLAHTGTISIAFHKVTNVRMAAAWKDVPSMYQYDKVPEKALKGSSVSHKTTLDPPERIAPVKFMEADYVDGEGRPFAVIEFRYRSAAALKSLAILPRSSSPAPVKDVVSEEEVKKIYLKQEEAETRKRNRADDDGDDGDVEMVNKRPAKRRCFPTSNDEVIELD
ncbi:unnamed protein product [Alternaria alternata]|uniref:DUF7918 domain-containing protein n=1 Tax=Alternaria tenuissima TaxID=119927 RepID=A0A4Q4MIL6_9PLEO|nr:hypothetical protein AA0114_g5526 [Alternaria tenuissima]RYN57544.1 hypothetical protein AA0118_g7676 [Alternaria tenuissima]RYO64487.1 hypothetical protein AA0116_g3191 [Alternaria tenuissima]